MEFSEHIKTANVEDVVLRQPLHPPSRGTLCITGHHLLFSDREQGRCRQVLLLLRNVDAIEKSVENLLAHSGPFCTEGRSQRMSGSSGTITIKCKDLRVLQLDIPGMEQCLNIARSIETLSCLDGVSETYPFFYRPSDVSLQDQWGLSSPEKHYSQMRELHDRWRLSTVNRDYRVCPSYPPAVIVPKHAGDEMLEKAAKFRQGGRFPVLCYYHRKNGMVIMRSSQPLTGANRKRCREDEHLLRAVIDGSDRGFIIDTRSGQQALQARMTGGGFESESCYSNWKRLHRQMERDGHSVLVHGSEGTDSTLLISTLAQLIMDPCSRTLEGFLALLEREWIQAGHPFQQRCAHSAYSHARLQQESPVFLLLLDCVWQLWCQFPLALGFSEALLLRLATEAYASDYGTFLCNSHQERCALGVKDNTYCLFRGLLRPRERDSYSNPLYEPTELAIWPSVHPQALQLWRGFFLRWTPQVRHLEEAQEDIRNMVTEWGKLALS
ncbi:myotubularin-related protein 9-like isoform X3 [Cyclopterus lumpus]|uniref:myotubularin-related protein 9-like isoform X3 n=1 Tax=Cyclopterus lumpus TaxID=8103 RepID=UPI001485E868|nr:myotubularin-related protein 9-like isoform X3 [Cyclopterus lumpus]